MVWGVRWGDAEKDKCSVHPRHCIMGEFHVHNEKQVRWKLVSIGPASTKEDNMKRMTRGF